MIINILNDDNGDKDGKDDDHNERTVFVIFLSDHYYFLLCLDNTFLNLICLALVVFH